VGNGVAKEDNYYNRKPTILPDGRRAFMTEKDKALEDAVKAMLNFGWKAEIGSFGRFFPIDFYAYKKEQKRVVAILELKTHPYEYGKYATTPLNCRKHAFLMDRAKQWDVIPILLKLFNEHLYYVDVRLVDAAAPVMGGCKRIVKSVTDVEPVIHIPLETFKYVGRIMHITDYDRKDLLAELPGLERRQ